MPKNGLRVFLYQALALLRVVPAPGSEQALALRLGAAGKGLRSVKTEGQVIFYCGLPFVSGSEPSYISYY